MQYNNNSNKLHFRTSYTSEISAKNIDYRTEKVQAYSEFELIKDCFFFLKIKICQNVR